MIFIEGFFHSQRGQRARGHYENIQWFSKSKSNLQNQLKKYLAQIFLITDGSSLGDKVQNNTYSKHPCLLLDGITTTANVMAQQVCIDNMFPQ